jgi:8-oxo-dGTP diphosphatase
VETVTEPRQVTRVSAYALCLEEGRLLLCRIAPGWWGDVGSWTLPGGGIDFGESPADAAVRELAEETGLVGEIIGLAEVLDHGGRWIHPIDGVDEAHHGIQVLYRVRVVGGVLRPEADGSTDAAAWFTREEAENLPLVGLVRESLALAFGEI